jgi:hypothetical protein
MKCRQDSLGEEGKNQLKRLRTASESNAAEQSSAEVVSGEGDKVPAKIDSQPESKSAKNKRRKELRREAKKKESSTPAVEEKDAEAGVEAMDVTASTVASSSQAKIDNKDKVRQCQSVFQIRDILIRIRILGIVYSGLRIQIRIMLFWQCLLSCQQELVFFF